MIFLNHYVIIIWVIKMKILRRLSAFQIIIISFALIVLLGTGLLMLPVSSKERVVTPFLDSLFTATSATCVTGLVVQDTATYWSTFGKCVLLTLIQIGGLGVITIAMWIAWISGRKIGLMQRGLMQESISASNTGGIIRFTLFSVKITLALEALGAFFLSFRFCKEYGLLDGIKYSVFHSVSAFCNAGFDLMGTKEKFSSLTSVSSEWYLNIIIILLIVIGGIGFNTWNDIVVNKFKIKKYSMQSKAILLTSLLLIVIPAVYFYFFDFSDSRWSMSTSHGILASLFQSVTMRTAGFNTVDLSQMSGGSTVIMIFLMLIGGSPGSTAGGLKTTTVAVLFASTFSVFRRNKQTKMFGRSISEETVQNASAILMLYLMLFMASAVSIFTIEGVPIRECLFECASAVGTVGLSLGLTTQLCSASRIIIILLMFIGRVGGLTMIYAAVSKKQSDVAKLPQERITVG